MICTENIASLLGADVIDRDGDKIGSVGQVYLDDDEHPSWASLRTVAYQARAAGPEDLRITSSAGGTSRAGEAVPSIRASSVCKE